MSSSTTTMSTSMTLKPRRCARPCEWPVEFMRAPSQTPRHTKCAGIPNGFHHSTPRWQRTSAAIAKLANSCPLEPRPLPQGHRSQSSQALADSGLTASPRQNVVPPTRNATTVDLVPRDSLRRPRDSSRHGSRFAPGRPAEQLGASRFAARTRSSRPEARCRVDPRGGWPRLVPAAFSPKPARFGTEAAADRPGARRRPKCCRYRRSTTLAMGLRLRK